MKLRRVGKLDHCTLFRDETHTLFILIRGHIKIDGVSDFPLEGYLVIKWQNNQPVGVKIFGIDNDDLPDTFNYVFEGDHGESYSGVLQPF